MYAIRSNSLDVSFIYYRTYHSLLQINLYQNLLRKKHGELLSNMERLEGGLEKLKSTASQVDDLKEKLAAQEVELTQKNEDADALIKRVGIEQEKVPTTFVSIFSTPSRATQRRLDMCQLSATKKLLHDVASSM